jgi:ubiquinone/menaquinone biosynthesis C-methylase UbiE
MREELLEPLLRSIRIRRIFTWLPVNGIVCDIGCGFEASFLKSIHMIIKHGYGFDKKVNEEFFGNLELYNHDLDKPLPLLDCSVDCVTMLAVLEHIEKPIPLFHEISRIIKQGGFLIITTPTPKSKKILEFLAFKLKIVSPQEIADHKHYWTEKEIVELVEENGFSLIKYNLFSFGFNSFLVAKRN